MLYGAGVVGKSYFSQFMEHLGCQIVAWVDKKHKECLNGLRKSIASIVDIEYDIIVIAIQKRSVANEIIQSLIALDINEGQIVWREPVLNV